MIIVVIIADIRILVFFFRYDVPGMILHRGIVTDGLDHERLTKTNWRWNRVVLSVFVTQADVVFLANKHVMNFTVTLPIARKN